MKCPGQDSLYWKSGAIFEVECPRCGKGVEFFKDDTSRRCAHCGHRFVNPKMDFGCAAYCQYAEQCLGTLPPEIAAQQENLLKDRVALEMKRYFKRDFTSIGHAMRVARHAERIAKMERANPAVVLSAAYLHDIGIPEAERIHGGSAAEYPEKEGPGIARSILQGLGAKEPLIDAVCDIIGHHHHPRAGDGIEFQVVYDADRIADLEERVKAGTLDRDRIAAAIETSFLTKSGKEIAKDVLQQTSEVKR